MDGDIVTVDCISSDRCGGHVTLRLMEAGGVLPSGTEFKGLVDTLVRQTCDCEYSDDDRESLVERARLTLDRQQREQAD